MSWWSSALKAIQLPPRFLFGVWLLGCLITLDPKGLSTILGVAPLIANYRGWIGLVTLAAFAFWLVQLAPKASKWLRERRGRQQILAHASTLSFDERVMLGFCIIRKQRTICTDYTNPAAKSLVQKGLLNEYVGGGDSLEWPHTIPEFAWKYLVKNKSEILTSKVKKILETYKASDKDEYY